MKIEYKLNEEDFLIHLWYQLENHKDFHKAKLQYYFRVPSIIILVGLVLSFVLNDYSYLTICLLISPVWLFFAPKLYKKEKQKEIEMIAKNHVRKRDSESAILIIKDDHIIGKEDFSESKHYKTEIANLTEIENYYIINLKDQVNKLLIPKEYITKPKEFVNKLTNMDVQYIDNSHWRWEK
ncbi:hypothetical protein [Aquimarina latercula]|uniref:hypothetical protein n=1 Tax=Aquimarina latercula TaxID=987 RepID=UPI00042389B1|nr:hypothetical protein [Aquimarina latercula]